MTDKGHTADGRPIFAVATPDEGKTYVVMLPGLVVTGFEDSDSAHSWILAYLDNAADRFEKAQERRALMDAEVRATLARAMFDPNLKH